MTEQHIEVGQRWLGKMSKREYKVIYVNHKSVCIENDQGVLYTDYLDDFSDSYTLIPEWQPSKPRYRSFEIDWDTFKYPITICGYSCDIGYTIDGYRIYGYGDINGGSQISYYHAPCNHDRDRVYAYGRYVGGAE